MGEEDRRTMVRRQIDTNNRLDDHARVIEAFKSTLNQHRTAIDDNYRNLKSDMEADKQEADDMLGRLKYEYHRIDSDLLNLDARLVAIENIHKGPFLSRLRWLFTGVPVIR